LPEASWKEPVRIATEEGSFAALLACIRGQKTAHAGTPPAAMKREMARLLRHRLSGAALSDLAFALARSEEPGAQEVGALLLIDTYEDRPDAALAALATLCQSPHWEVREWAGSALGSVLETHFDVVLPQVRAWAQDTSDLLRRGVVIALMECASRSGAPVVEPVLDILGGLLRDPSPYVQANLGPFAIGSALAAQFPDAVCARLRIWVRDEDERTRRQVALIFSAAAGARIAAPAGDLLDVLAADERPAVQRALRRARARIAKVAGEG
jgi:hypothetical protein